MQAVIVPPSIPICDLVNMSDPFEQQPHDASSVIKPDDDPYSADDPAFLTDSDASSSTQSLSSSVLNY